MSLSFHLDKITDYETRCWTDGDGGRRMNLVTEVLVFATMSTGINRITEKNADEFYARVDMLQRIYGAFLYRGDGSDKLLTPEDVQAHIGLATNASAKTRAVFLRDLGLVLDDRRRAYRQATKEPVAA
jgi:hypothetical protein